MNKDEVSAHFMCIVSGFLNEQTYFQCNLCFFFSFEVFTVGKKIEQKASLSKNAVAHFNSPAV